MKTEDQKNTALQIAVMQAFVDGKDIEVMDLNDVPQWEKHERPDWNWGFCDYRVAPPKPRKFKRWFLVHSSGALTSNYATKEEAITINNTFYPRREVVCFEMTEIV